MAPLKHADRRDREHRRRVDVSAARREMAALRRHAAAVDRGYARLRESL
jgi:hypothetical protein